MKLRILATAVLGAALLSPASWGAKKVVKLATLAPDGSVWHQSLEEMGNDWARATEGRVTLRIYPGGVAGDDPDMVRKMRIGQLHAASLSIIGLVEIDEAFNIFAIPMFFRSPEELRYVLERIEPDLRGRLEEKGFVFLNWGDGGWIHFFTKSPVRSVDDLKGVKMFAAAGNERWVQWWKSNGYQPVALATTDILTGLQTGMIDAYPTTPLAALSLQWFRQTPYMLDIGLAPLVGATVMPAKAWSGIDEGDREALRAAARQVEARLLGEVPEQDRAAVVEMEKRGLTVVRISDPAKLEVWSRTAEGFAESMRGKMVPADIFDRARAARDDYRRTQSAGDAP